MQNMPEALRAGSRLRVQAPQIIETWVGSVRLAIPAANTLQIDVLRNTLPELLGEIARELDSDHGAPFQRAPMLARGHGAERAKVPGYSLATVILEYRILRRTVVNALSVTEPLDRGDGEIIIDAFEEAMQDAASEYTSYAQNLVKADEHKSELLAVVCHELRSPLACIQNALFILEIEGVSERSQRQVEAANRQMRKITRILSDLIDIASIAEGKVALRMTPLTIENVINDAISTVLPLIEGRDQTITLKIASHGIIINGDADRLEQIMLNLLNNSAKYTEAGGEISVALDKENEEAVIRVKDTGIGIDPLDLPKVFDMFHQVAPGTVPSGDGVGIGLGVVKRLAELHGGSVCVDSRGRGLGSEFTLRLPLFGVNAAAAPGGAAVHLELGL